MTANRSNGEQVAKSGHAVRTAFGRTMLMLGVLLPGGCTQSPTSTLDTVFYEHYSRYSYCSMFFTRQSTDYSCGAACLSSILGYWGNYTSEYELLRDYPKGHQRGYFLSDLKMMAENSKLHAYIISMQANPQHTLLEQIRKGRPVVCAVSYPRGFTPAREYFFIGPFYNAIGWILGKRVDHYIVAFGYRDDSLLIMDPAAGIVDLSWEKFEDCWQEQKYAALVVAR